MLYYNLYIQIEVSVIKVNNKILKKSAQYYSVLYVEDDAIVRESTSEFFSSYFKEVVVAVDGREALEEYKKYFNTNNKYFDIVISDIQMPNMNGIELTKEIFNIHKKQKIIIVSAYNEVEYFIELIRIGISGFMQKPLTSVQMLDILYEVCLELDIEKEKNRFIHLSLGFTWDTKLKILSYQSNEISLTSNETMILHLFFNNLGKTFTDIEIFNHIHFNDYEKEFSSNSIKSLFKRLRKKIPQELIVTYKNLGYCIK